MQGLLEEAGLDRERDNIHRLLKIGPDPAPDEVDEGAALVLKVAVSDGIIAPGYTERALEILKAKELPEMPPIKEFREAPDAREYVRRYQLWELLGWYEHEVVRPNRGLKGFLRRLWWRVTGQKVKLMSPFQQLIYRDRALALQQARKEVEERAESQGL